MATQEIVLRATGGLMTMLTAPGAGTNTETGSSHQDAFDDLADAEAHEIAAIIQESVIVPILEQWHPGQPVLVEFVLKRPDRDDTGVAVQNITALAQTGYRVSDEDVQAMTGLKVNSAIMDSTAIYAAKAAGYTPTLAAMEDRMGMPLKPVPVLEPSAVNSLEKRYAPLMLWQPARDTFERACNARRGFIQEGEPLSSDELDAIHNLANAGLNPDQISADAATAASALEDAVANSDDPDRDKDGRFAPKGTGVAPKDPDGDKPDNACRIHDKHPSEWVPLQEPGRITAEEARKQLAEGVRETDPLGHEVSLDERMIKHWEENSKSEEDIKHRLSQLPLMRELVKQPAEIWEDEESGSLTYLASAIGNDGKKYIVGFTPGGEDDYLETFWPDSKRIGKKRQGKKIFPSPAVAPST